MKARKISVAACLILTAVVLVSNGCGGGGGGGGSVPTVSGVAAAGAPLAGQVSMIDAKGALAPGSPKTLNANGSFAFNVSGMTAPFILKAVGTVGGAEFTMFSIAMNAGTANVNPMSSFALAAAAGVNDPATLYNPGANLPTITQASLNTAIANMQSMMANVLSPYGAGSINPITGSYTANHTGLDAVFDVVRMTINTTTGTLTITDKTAGTTGTTLGTATIAQMMAATPPAAVPAVSNSSLPTDMQNITTMLANLGSTLNKGATLATTDLDPFFAPDPGFGLNNGRTRTQMESYIQGGVTFFLGGRTISQMSGVTFMGNKGGGYVISFQMHMSDGSTIMSNMTFADEFDVVKNTTTGAWQITGNGYHSLAANSMLNQQWMTAAGVQTQGGIHFDMSDPGNVFKSAEITGPGLPANGVEMIKEPASAATFMLASTNKVIPSKSDKFHTMSDAEIASISNNAPFTFSFYSSLPPRNNPMEQRILTFPTRCLTSTEAAATAGLYPTVTPTGNLSTHSFSTMMGNMMMGMMGGMLSMPFTYTTPTGLPVTMMNASFRISSTTFGNEVNQSIMLNGTSATMQMSGPVGPAPTSGTGSVDVMATDTFARTTATSWMFQ